MARPLRACPHRKRWIVIGKALLLGVTARKVSIFTLLPLATLLAADTRTHPAPGTSIIHFGQVDAGVYKGSKPKTDADFRYLQSLHIQYIVNLQFLPFLSEAEEKKARKYGIKFIDRTINASPVAPSEKHIDVTLATLRDKRYHPVYFHCSLGRHRTSLITALYRNYYLARKGPIAGPQYSRANASASPGSRPRFAGVY